jgi:hypothetical protein
MLRYCLLTLGRTITVITNFNGDSLWWFWLGTSLRERWCDSFTCDGWFALISLLLCFRMLRFLLCPSHCRAVNHQTRRYPRIDHRNVSVKLSERQSANNSLSWRQNRNGWRVSTSSTTETIITSTVWWSFPLNRLVVFWRAVWCNRTWMQLIERKSGFWRGERIKTDSTSSHGKEAAISIQMCDLGSKYRDKPKSAISSRFLFIVDPLRNSSIQSPNESSQNFL